MKSVLSYAGHRLSENSFYSAFINPLGFFYHGGLKSVRGQKKKWGLDWKQRARRAGTAMAGQPRENER